MLMPFGKHRGTPIEQVPKDYLQWLERTCKLRGKLKTAVEYLKAGMLMPEPQDNEAILAELLARSERANRANRKPTDDQ